MAKKLGEALEAQLDQVNPANICRVAMALQELTPKDRVKLTEFVDMPKTRYPHTWVEKACAQAELVTVPSAAAVKKHREKMCTCFRGKK